MPGPGGIVIPHTHEIMINENINDISQLNTMTSVSQGHSHEIRNGVLIEVLKHTHIISI
jgi:hypothetical protein